MGCYMGWQSICPNKYSAKQFRGNEGKSNRQIICLVAWRYLFRRARAKCSVPIGSTVLHPVSASRRAAALRKPWNLLPVRVESPQRLAHRGTLVDKGPHADQKHKDYRAKKR